MTAFRDVALDQPVPLAAKVAFLKRPDSYPEQPDSVEAIETHMSWVFLTEHHAYKLKKPVRYDFLDFSTLEARQHDCQEEVRLNRRLAPDVYLGTVPMMRHPGGSLSLIGTGAIEDWLVKMRRLPRDRMLDQAIRDGRVEDADLEQVATILAEFYRASAPIKLSAPTYRDRFRSDVRANFEALSDPRFGLNARLVEGVCTAQLRLVDQRPGLLDERVAQGRVIEAHGDLRPEHICLCASPVIIDCLEFNREFRILDSVDELSFLAMECELLGAAFVGQRAFEVYREVTGDDPSPALIAFYKCYRASLRAKLAVWHIVDPETNHPTKWTARANDYLSLADGYAEELRA